MLPRPGTGCDRAVTLPAQQRTAIPVQSPTDSSDPIAPDGGPDAGANAASKGGTPDEPAGPGRSQPAAGSAPVAGRPWLRRTTFLIKGLVSAGLIWLLLQGQDLGDLARTLTRLPVWGAAGALVTILAMIGLITQRWRTIIGRLGAAQRPGFALRLTFIGQFFSQGLPTSFGGDAVRVWILYRRGTGLGTATRSVLLDRMTALVALLLMVGASLPLLAAFTEDRLVLLSLGGLVAAGLAGLCLFLCLDSLPAAWRCWAPVAQLALLAGQARALLLDPATALRILGLSVLGHLGSVLSVWTLAVGLGLDLPLGAAVCLVPPVILATALPISIAGWGVREGAMVGVLGLVGIGADEAFAVSVLFGLGLVLTALPGAGFWLADRGRGQTGPAPVPADGQAGGQAGGQRGG